MSQTQGNVRVVNIVLEEMWKLREVLYITFKADFCCQVEVFYQADKPLRCLSGVVQKGFFITESLDNKLHPDIFGNMFKIIFISEV